MTAASPAPRRLSSRRSALPVSLVVGLVLLAPLLVAAFAGSWIAPYPYDEMNIMSRLQPPGPEFWFGTDEFGRDVFSRTLVGTGSSLLMGVAATALSLMAGVPLGLIAGYKGGRAGEAIMRAMDVLMSFPPILLGILVLAVTPPAQWKAIVAIGIVYVPQVVRLARAITLELMQEEFITAARLRGESAAYILFHEILPNIWPPLAVEASLRVVFAILLGASLSFIGMGAQPPSSDWGLMIAEARPFVEQAPWIALCPGFALAIAVIGINLLGDGLRALLDPRNTGSH
ncbi:ABC transporter permease [Azospirillum picis]|uniref:Peptide/nickel transport system permease protein n=1 Tax=Azospirillum picis TaxID=488438 RepID=A0ABU0MMT3_9PROT|nr:ABC transporter permease [Azospirillum picis]MBP2300742.1 peptide/nickel transport system permease protein [Azospirillum picis]MDQ0534711.1 peptide/nickel transport system permease protein [Azospirillum picis]